MKKNLTINRLKNAAKLFCEQESTYNNKDLYGVTDGKAVGTYIEHRFQEYLSKNYTYEQGNAANGIDLPGKLMELATILLLLIKLQYPDCIKHHILH